MPMGPSMINFPGRTHMPIKPLLFALCCFSWSMILSGQTVSAPQTGPDHSSVEAGSDEYIDKARRLRALMQSDPHRPIFHFVSPEGHCMPFDPNGAIFWKGRYHLGYIYQSRKRGNAEHVWGHAVSTDLLHWSLYPDMLDVRDGDIEKGIFSGGTFLSREGVPHIIYHGAGSSTNLVAYSKDDDLRYWQKFEGNPVLRTSEADDPFNPKGVKYTAWDPEAWYDVKADYYYQISGGKNAGLFKSRDMYKWEYLGGLIDKKDVRTYESEDISCPDMFTIGAKRMLLFISHNIGAQYYLGTFAHDRFAVEAHGRMNWPGGTFFAPEQLQDNKGRNIIWGWVLERKPERFPNYGWSGIMSLPRVLTLDKKGELQIAPAEELRSIRLENVEEKSFSLAPDTERTLSGKGTSLEIQVEMKGGRNSPYGVKVFRSPDGREETVIRYDPLKKELVIDFIRSSVSGPVRMPAHAMFKPAMPGFPETVSEQRAPLELGDGELLHLDIFIDRSIVEVFANGRQCITQVVYPELAASTEVSVFTVEEAAVVKKAVVWKMAQTNAY